MYLHYYCYWFIIVYLFPVQSELSFTVCLQYQYINLDEDVHERRLVTVGKPLVSKLNLHEPQRLPISSAPISSDLLSSSMPQYPSFSQDLQASLPSLNASASFTESNESYFNAPAGFSSDPKRINEPEESISPEFLMSEEPRKSKSFTHPRANKPFTFSNFHSF